jgi:hypothetical protein
MKSSYPSPPPEGAKVHANLTSIAFPRVLLHLASRGDGHPVHVTAAGDLSWAIVV